MLAAPPISDEPALIKLATLDCWLPVFSWLLFRTAAVSCDACDFAIPGGVLRLLLDSLGVVHRAALRFLYRQIRAAVDVKIVSTFLRDNITDYFTSLELLILYLLRACLRSKPGIVISYRCIVSGI